MRDVGGGPFGVFRAAIILHYFASYFCRSLWITFALCWPIFADSCFPPSLLSCVGVQVSMTLGKYLFHWVFFSVWRCQLAAAGGGGSSFQGCLGCLLTYFLHLAFPAKHLGTRGLFLESHGIFLGPESCFVFVVFAFKINVSIIFKIIQWNISYWSNIWFVG